MSNREEFEKWYTGFLLTHGRAPDTIDAHQNCQPEIDALKTENAGLRDERDAHRDNAQKLLELNRSILAENVVLKAAPTPPDDEPVLWYEADPEASGKDIRHVIGSMLYSTRIHSIEPRTTRPVWPLYTRPANDELRKAAEEIIKIWKGEGRTDMYGKAIENLEAAVNKGKS